MDKSGAGSEHWGVVIPSAGENALFSSGDAAFVKTMTSIVRRVKLA
ncbi:MAG: hypothetical protein ACTTKL_07645 [Treponema sp.]